MEEVMRKVVAMVAMAAMAVAMAVVMVQVQAQDQDQIPVLVQAQDQDQAPLKMNPEAPVLRAQLLAFAAPVVSSIMRRVDAGDVDLLKEDGETWEIFLLAAAVASQGKLGEATENPWYWWSQPRVRIEGAPISQGRMRALFGSEMFRRWHSGYYTGD